MARDPWVAKADKGIRFGVQFWNCRGVDGDGHWRRLDAPMRTFLEAGRLVESLGFDAIFTDDHPVLSLTDPWPLLAALAATTERVRLGALVNCIYYRHPAHLARLAADVDEISNGRLVLGLGIGWAAEEFRALGIQMDGLAVRHGALEEAMAIIDGVWGTEPFSLSGSTFTVDGVALFPPHSICLRPPILIGGAGERRTLRQVARLGDACNLLERDDVEMLRHKLEVLRRHCEEVGRPYNEVLRTHRGPLTLLASGEAEARAKFVAYVADDASERSQGAFWACTPDQAVRYFNKRSEAGIQYFIVAVDASDQETLSLLAGEVVPRVAESSGWPRSNPPDDL